MSPDEVLAKWDALDVDVRQNPWRVKLAEALRVALKERDEVDAHRNKLDARNSDLLAQLAEARARIQQLGAKTSASSSREDKP